MRKGQLAISALFVVSFLVACAPGASPAPAAPAPAKTVAQAPVAPAAPLAKAPSQKAAWQLEWNTAEAEAKKEGRVAIISTAGSEVRSALLEFARAEGLKGEVLSGRGAEITAKTFAERRAGLYLADIYIGSINTALNILKPPGILERLDSSLVLPEVTDSKQWYQGKLPWCDKDHTIIIFNLQPRQPIAINTNLVKPEDVKSWRDLLHPKWKGRLVLNDPTLGGSGQMAIQALLGIMGDSYVRELGKADLIIMRDERLQLDWLSHGKVAIVIGEKPEMLPEFMKTGAPIRSAIPAEGTWLSASSGSLSLIKNAPHPNAAKVFINWLAGKEGQTVLATAGGYHSPRLDVSTAHLQPDMMRVEGAKYFDATTEEEVLKRDVIIKLVKEVFEPMVK